MVSVIVPVYNTGKYLRKCVDSLLEQTYSDVEIILVDDGSTDESPAICDDYAAKHKNVAVIHQANSGVSRARNRGLEAMHGEYVCFVDSDDYVEKNYIEALLDALEKDKADVAECNIMRECKGERSFPLYMNQAVLRKNEIYEYWKAANKVSFPYVYAPSCRRLFKTSIIKDNDIRFPEGVWTSEDQVFLYLYMQYVQTITVIPDVYYIYVDRDTSVCNNQFVAQRNIKRQESHRALAICFLEFLANSHCVGQKKWASQALAYFWDLEINVYPYERFLTDEENVVFRKTVRKRLPILLSAVHGHTQKKKALKFAMIDLPVCLFVRRCQDSIKHKRLIHKSRRIDYSRVRERSEARQGLLVYLFADSEPQRTVESVRSIMEQEVEGGFRFVVLDSTADDSIKMALEAAGYKDGAEGRNTKLEYKTHTLSETTVAFSYLKFLFDEAIVSSARYLAIFHNDDLILKGMLSSELAALKKESYAACGYSAHSSQTDSVVCCAFDNYRQCMNTALTRRAFSAFMYDLQRMGNVPPLNEAGEAFGAVWISKIAEKSSPVMILGRPMSECDTLPPQHTCFDFGIRARYMLYHAAMDAAVSAKEKFVCLMYRFDFLIEYSNMRGHKKICKKLLVMKRRAQPFHKRLDNVKEALKDLLVPPMRCVYHALLPRPVRRALWAVFHPVKTMKVFCLDRKMKMLFDKKYYLNEHPEVRNSGMSAFKHYMTVGYKIGFEPSPVFKGKLYLEMYPDLKKARVNPLKHWVEQGKKNGKKSPIVKAFASTLVNKGVYEENFTEEVFEKNIKKIFQ